MKLWLLNNLRAAWIRLFPKKECHLCGSKDQLERCWNCGLYVCHEHMESAWDGHWVQLAECNKCGPSYENQNYRAATTEEHAAGEPAGEERGSRHKDRQEREFSSQ